MAAHPYTMLQQMSESLAKSNPIGECNMIAHAMMYTQQADSIIEGLDIYDLASNQYHETLKRFIDAIIPKYKSIWEALGKPRNWEDWRNTMLSLKTRAKSNYRSLYRQSFSMWDYMSEFERNNFRHR